MDSRFLSLVVLCALAIAAFATDVRQCPGMSIADLKDRAQLTPCKKTPCRLKKGTRPHISLQFTPEEDLHQLTNHVEANVLGVPLPFVGVDGTTVCGKIFLADEPDTPAKCPLKAGTKYVYKDSFPILSFYPTINTKIHWALQTLKKDQTHKKDVVCFEVDAKIVS